MDLADFETLWNMEDFSTARLVDFFFDLYYQKENISYLNNKVSTKLLVRIMSCAFLC